MEIFLAGLAIHDQQGTQKDSFSHVLLHCLHQSQEDRRKQDGYAVVSIRAAEGIPNSLFYDCPKSVSPIFRLQRAEERNHTLILRIRCTSNFCSPPCTRKRYFATQTSNFEGTSGLLLWSFQQSKYEPRFSPHHWGKKSPNLTLSSSASHWNLAQHRS